MGTNKAPKRKAERGGYGNKRGKERQRRRTERRMQDPRVQAAMAETHQAQEALETRMAYEQANPVVDFSVAEALKAELANAREVQARVEREVEAERLALVPEPEPEPEVYVTPAQDEPEYIQIRLYKKFDIDSIPPRQEGKQGWTLGNSRQLLIKGYSLEHIVKTTGWGKQWFDDIPVDEEGYGLGQQAWLEALEKKAEHKEGLSS